MKHLLKLVCKNINVKALVLEGKNITMKAREQCH